MTILLTGVTGTCGRPIAKALAGSGARVRALVRVPAKAADLAAMGIELVAGDLTRPETFGAAFMGVERAFLLAPNVLNQLEIELGFVYAARAHGVRHLVKLSAIGASIAHPARVTRWHGAVELALRGAGMAWTVIRPSFFMQNLLHSAPTIARDGRIYLPMGSGRTGMIDVRDVAPVAVRCLTEDGHDGRIYTLTGPASISFAEAATAIGAAIGKRVDYVAISPAEFKGAMLGFGVAEWEVDYMNEIFAEIAKDHGDSVTGSVERLTGRAPRDIHVFARDHAAALAG
jgi:uncharacterized protein YbjT (DUF2867 family)